MNLLDRTPPQADHRLAYGPGPWQFGDLWIPTGHAGAPPRWPVVISVHGGWWQAQFGLGYAGFLCQAMKALGIAVWSLEYRRVGDVGGGWPGTFSDVAAGTDYLVELARKFPLDTARVIAAGHSAGGHLVFWLAGRHHVPPESPLHEPQPAIGLRGVVALAGAVDLRLTLELGGLFRFSDGKPAVESLMGGLPEQFPQRYRAGNPGDLLPLSVAQILVQGAEDDQIPPALPARWAQQARRQGDAVEVKIVQGATHFDVVDPESKAWPASRDAMLKLLSV